MTSTYGGGSRGGSKLLQVKNKSAAPVQITAEQLLREAVDRQAAEITAPRQRIMDEDELQQYRVRKRKEYEDSLRRQRHHIGTWIKYAQWEAGQKEFRRARSIFERALHIDYQNTSLWLKYIEMEVSNKFVNSARNLYDRVTQLLPRVDQFWFKYAHMEELLSNYAGARAIYERWMEWEPEDKGWLMYIKFEERCNEIERARQLFERYVSCRPSEESSLRLCKFEERHKNTTRCRAGFEACIDILGADQVDQSFYIKFAQFEHRQRETERALAIYKQALDLLGKNKSEELYTAFVAYQKQHAKRQDLEETVFEKRRLVYEDEVQTNPHSYDSWFDYLRLEEEIGDVARIRDLYERAVACIPPIQEKKHWKRYVFLWINYALFEEIVTEDVERCRKVYTKALEIIPHQMFSFQKLWQYFAEFEIRQLDLTRARRIFGCAIGQCGKPGIFTMYAGLELRLGNVDRCRKILAKFVEKHPRNPKSWIALIELETMAEEMDRARAICEIALEIEEIEFMELIWKAYIDLEINAQQIPRARELYNRLLNKSRHVKVYKSFSEFEATIAQDMINSRRIIEEGLEHCKRNDFQEERKTLLEHWLKLEVDNGDEAIIRKVWDKQPKKVKKRRNVVTNDGTSQGWEEYTAYIFPDDTQLSSNLKILEAAKRWKKAQMSTA